MKKFIVNSLFFGILLFANHSILFMVSYYAYLDDYIKVNLDYETYLLSDSHGLPLDEFMQQYGVYNFSSGGDSYFDMLSKLKYLIRYSNIKKILINVDDHTLGLYRQNYNNVYRSNYFTDREDYLNVFDFVDKKYIKTYYVLSNPKIRAILERYLISVIFRTKKDIDKKWHNYTDDEKTKRSKMRFNRHFINDQISESLTIALNKILILCSKNNIEIIGIKFPLSKNYHDTIGNLSYGADSIFYANNIKVKDYRKLFLKEDTLFRNQDHLNELAGKNFAEILSKSLN